MDMNQKVKHEKREQQPTHSNYKRETSTANVELGIGNRKTSLYLSRAASIPRISNVPPIDLQSSDSAVNEVTDHNITEESNTEQERHVDEAVVEKTVQHRPPSSHHEDKPKTPISTAYKHNPDTPVFSLSREFTFTGYDIMADVPPVTKRISKKQKERDNASSLYRTTCHQLGIIPVSYLCQRFLNPVIKMKSHGLGPTGTKAIAIALLHNTNVTSLDLEDNGIGSEGVKCISQMLEENTSITDLRIGENLMGSEGLAPLSDMMTRNQFLTILDISGNALIDKDAVMIKTILENNKHLLELNLSHNQLGEEGGIQLAKAIVSNDSLEVLDISWNHLRGKGAVAIGTNLKKNFGLKKLNVSWNGFAVDGCTAIGKSLKTNYTLEELNLTSNRIEANAVGPLINGVQRNDNLKILRLGQNPMTPDVCVAILQGLQKSTKTVLELLDLEDIKVDKQFEDLLSEIHERLPLKVITGASIRGTETIYRDERGISGMDPVKLLFEYMNKEGLRIIDLFTSLDKDGSRSVSHEEFREGLLSVDVPLTEDQIEQLIERLDKDKDGEVDFSELIDGERTYKRKQLRIKMKKEEEEKLKRKAKRKALLEEKLIEQEKNRQEIK